MDFLRWCAAYFALCFVYASFYVTQQLYFDSSNIFYLPIFYQYQLCYYICKKSYTVGHHYFLDSPSSDDSFFASSVGFKYFSTVDLVFLHLHYVINLLDGYFKQVLYLLQSFLRHHLISFHITCWSCLQLLDAWLLVTIIRTTSWACNWSEWFNWISRVPTWIIKWLANIFKKKVACALSTGSLSYTYNVTPL